MAASLSERYRVRANPGSSGPTSLGGLVVIIRAPGARLRGAVQPWCEGGIAAYRGAGDRGAVPRSQSKAAYRALDRFGRTFLPSLLLALRLDRRSSVVCRVQRGNWCSRLTRPRSLCLVTEEFLVAAYESPRRRLSRARFSLDSYCCWLSK